jgi:hypothetical protein
MVGNLPVASFVSEPAYHSIMTETTGQGNSLTDRAPFCMEDSFLDTLRTIASRLRRAITEDMLLSGLRMAGG